MQKTYRGSIWKIGTKDNKVYMEMWDADDTTRVLDGELSPDEAYGIGKSLMDNAIKQGYRAD